MLLGASLGGPLAAFLAERFLAAGVTQPLTAGIFITGQIGLLAIPLLLLAGAAIRWIWPAFTIWHEIRRKRHAPGDSLTRSRAAQTASAISQPRRAASVCARSGLAATSNSRRDELQPASSPSCTDRRHTHRAKRPRRAPAGPPASEKPLAIAQRERRAPADLASFTARAAAPAADPASGPRSSPCPVRTAATRAAPSFPWVWRRAPGLPCR